MSRVQLMNARRPSQKTPNPLSRGAAQGAARGGFGIGRTKIAFHAVAKQQFVSKDFLIFGQNRLTRNKARARRRNSLSYTSLIYTGISCPRVGCTQSGRPHFIGRAAMRLHLATKEIAALPDIWFRDSPPRCYPVPEP